MACSKESLQRKMGLCLCLSEGVTRWHYFTVRTATIHQYVGLNFQRPWAGPGKSKHLALISLGLAFNHLLGNIVTKLSIIN